MLIRFFMFNAKRARTTLPSINLTNRWGRSLISFCLPGAARLGSRDFIAMKQIQIGGTPLRSSRLAYGCWRIAGTWDPAAVTQESEAKGKAAVLAAFEAGYTLFDHADIYCDGVAE